MPPSQSTWPRYPLKDLVDERGITYGVVQPGQPTTDGIPVVRVNNITPAGLRMDDMMRIDPAIAERYARSCLAGGEVLITLVGSVGNVAVVPVALAGGNVARAVGVIPVRRDIPSRWVAWCLQTPAATRYLEARLNTTVQKTLNLRDLAELEIPIPPEATIRSVTAILGAFEDKIDSDRRLAALFQEIATTMFRARFVDFVGESDFTETELGPLPKGWTVAPIGDVVKVVGGGTPSTKESRYWDGGKHCWATPKDLAGARSPVLLDTARHITDEGVRRISSRLLPPRTVLLSSRAPVGYTAMSMIEVAVNQGFIAIPPSGSVPSEYVLLWLRENMDRIKAHAGGTTFAEISKRAFRPLLMPVPPPSALTNFEQATRPMVDLIAGLEREIQALSRIRDGLLPKLVSGEIRVPVTLDTTEVIGALAEEVPA